MKKYLKKFIIIINLIFFTTSSFASNLEDIVNALAEIEKPNRSQALTYYSPSKKKEIQFFEYYNSKKGNECAFSIFDTNRKDAISCLQEGYINNKNVSNTLNSVLVNENQFNGKNFTNAVEMLNFYGRNLQMVDCIGGQLNFLDAIALTQGKSFSVYTKNTISDILVKVHTHWDKNNKNSDSFIHILYEDNHYNFLVPKNFKKQLKNAEEKEVLNLNQFKEDKLEELKENEKAINQIFSNNNNNENYSDDFDSEVIYFNKRNFRSNTIYSSSDDEIGSIESDNDEFLDSSDSSSSSSSDEDMPLIDLQLSSNNRNRIRLNKNDVYLVMRGSHQETLPNKTRDESLTLIHRHYTHKFNSSIGEEKSIALLGLARLMTILGYTPSNQDRETALKDLNNKLQIESSTMSKNNLLRHYASTYRIKILKKLGKYNALYSVFKTLRKNATRSANLDLAEIIIENDFIPRDMTAREAKEFANKCLSEFSKSTSSSSSRKRRRVPQKENGKNTVRPDFLREKICLDEKARLIKKLKRRNNTSSQRSVARRNFRNRDQTAKNNQRSVLRKRKRNSGTISSQENQIPNIRFIKKRKLNNGTSQITKRHSSNNENLELNENVDHIQQSDIAYLPLNNSNSLIEDNNEDENLLLLSPSQGNYSNSIVSINPNDSTDEIVSSDEDIDYTDENSDVLHENNSAINFVEPDSQQDQINYLFLKMQKNTKNSNEESQIEYAIKLYKLSKKLKNKKCIIQALTNLGNSGWHGKIENESFGDSFQCLVKAYEIAEKIDDKTSQIIILHSLGYKKWKGYLNKIYYRETDCFLASLRLAKNNGNKIGQAKALISLGRSRWEGKIDNKHYKPLDLFFEAYVIASATDSNITKMSALIGLGNSRWNGKIGNEYFTSYTCFHKAYLLSLKLGNKKAEALSLLGKGRTTKDGLSTAKKYYEQALNCAMEVGDQKLVNGIEKSIHNVKKVLGKKRTINKNTWNGYKKPIQSNKNNPWVYNRSDCSNDKYYYR